MLLGLLDMIRFVKGNLLESSAQALVNTVNTIGVMGKGIASHFKEVNYIFYSFYQNNAIGFNCLRSRFHISRLFYSKFSIGVLSSYRSFFVRISSKL